MSAPLVSLTYWKQSGMTSVTVTRPVSESGPLFRKVRVKTTCWPTRMVLGLVVLVICRSAVGVVALLVAQPVLFAVLGSGVSP